MDAGDGTRRSPFFWTLKQNRPREAGGDEKTGSTI
jgi:hypothetical protein